MDVEPVTKVIEEAAAYEYELKPCPFCGRRDLEYGEMWNPSAYWDSMMRGDVSGYVKCNYCGTVIVKGNTIGDAIRNWNRRAEV